MGVSDGIAVIVTAVTITGAAIGNYAYKSHYLDPVVVSHNLFSVGKITAGKRSFDRSETRQYFDDLLTRKITPYQETFWKKNEGVAAMESVVSRVYGSLDDPAYYTTNVVTAPEMANGLANEQAVDTIIQEEVQRRQ